MVSGSWIRHSLASASSIHVRIRSACRVAAQILYGERFTEKNGAQLKARFDTWVQNIANGQLVGFFGDLGELLREGIHDMQLHLLETTH